MTEINYLFTLIFLENNQTSNFGKKLIILTIVLLAISIMMIIINIFIYFKNRKVNVYSENNRFGQLLCSMYEEISEFDIKNNKKYNYIYNEGDLVKSKLQFDLRESIEIFDKRLVKDEDVKTYSKYMNFENLKNTAEENKKVMFDCRMKNKEGEYSWYSFLLQGLSIDDELIVMVYKSDISVIKNEQEEMNRQVLEALNIAEIANKQKDDFLSKMSHELRNSLNVVIGYMQLIKNNKTDLEKVDDCVTKADFATRYLLNVISDVIDTSMVANGEITIVNEKFDLKSFILTLSELYANQAKIKNIKFECKLDGLTENYLIGDKARLNQVLMNIFSNALKFTPSDGTITLNIAQTLIKEDLVYLRFTITDTGVGMDEEVMNRIFTPFQQEQNYFKKYGNYGLGLSIAKNIIKLMGGTIDVKSQKNKGSSFIVELQFVKAEKEKIEVSETVFEKVHALVVHDEEDLSEFMSILLYDCGVKNEKANSITSAIDIIKKAKENNDEYNLILIDYNFNGSNGLQLAKELRKVSGKDTLIVMSAYKNEELDKSLSSAGINVILSKPLFHSSILDMLVDNFNRYKISLSDTKKVYNFHGNIILLVEDNEMNADIAKEILTEIGCVVTIERNGQAAVKNYLSNKPYTYDAILMDINMPLMDGYQATQVIRTSDHVDAKKIPIIAMTANVFADDIFKAVSAGMNDHIAKPINIDSLYEILEKYLHQKDSKN